MRQKSRGTSVVIFITYLSREALERMHLTVNAPTRAHIRMALAAHPLVSACTCVRAECLAHHRSALKFLAHMIFMKKAVVSMMSITDWFSCV